MPSIIGSIPDKEVKPIMGYISQVRAALGDDTALTYNDFLVCLLIAALDLDN